MIENDIGEELIVQPVGPYWTTSSLLTISAFIAIGLVIGGILLINYLFEKKVWI
jgi:hypothetical protein